MKKSEPTATALAKTTGKLGRKARIYKDVFTCPFLIPSLSTTNSHYTLRYPSSQSRIHSRFELIRTTSIMGFTSYSGPASAFPGKETWLDFETIFNRDKQEMFQTGDSGEDVGRIFNAVLEAAKIGVEERVTFCIIMQESTGNVSVGTPNDQDGNPTGGLMQAEESPAFLGQYDLPQVGCPGSINSFGLVLI